MTYAVITLVGAALGVLTALAAWPHRRAAEWVSRVAGTVVFAAAMLGVIMLFPGEVYLGSALGGAMLVAFVLTEGVVVATHPLMVGRPYWERVWWGFAHASYLRRTRAADSNLADTGS